MPSDADKTTETPTKAMAGASLRKFMAAFERLVACIEARYNLTGKEQSFSLLPDTLAI